MFLSTIFNFFPQGFSSSSLFGSLFGSPDVILLSYLKRAKKLFEVATVVESYCSKAGT